MAEAKIIKLEQDVWQVNPSMLKMPDAEIIIPGGFTSTHISNEATNILLCKFNLADGPSIRRPKHTSALPQYRPEMLTKHISNHILIASTINTHMKARLI